MGFRSDPRLGVSELPDAKRLPRPDPPIQLGQCMTSEFDQ